MDRKKIKRLKEHVFSALEVIILLGLASAIGLLFREQEIPETNIVLLYLLAVVITAMRTTGYTYGLLVSVAATFAFNYFFTVPYHSFAVYDPGYFITFFFMTATAILTSTLTIKVKKSAEEARESEMETMALFHLTSRLTEAGDIREIMDITVKTISQVLECQAGFICYEDEQSTEAEPRAVFRDIPANGAKHKFGVVRIPIERAQQLTEEQKQFLNSIMESSVLAMDKIYSAKQHIKIQQEIIQERYRSNLLRAISHDLRTPLSGIIGTAEMLMDMTDQEDQRYQLSKDIYKDADWLHSLVENILSLTRIQEGNLTIDKQPEAIEEVIGSAVRRMSARAPEYEIMVHVPQEVLMVHMDAKLMMQVFINLLDNAVKHSKANKKITVCVWEDTETQEAVIVVSDHGEGIRSADLPNVFQMFYTTKHKSSDAQKGIGLGLTICEAIVTAHGGTIKAKNRTEGKGAELTVRLPV